MGVGTSGRVCMFVSLVDLNTQALAWLNTTANRRVHGTTGEVPLTRLPSEGLQPMAKALSYDTSILTTRRSSKDCTISYGGNVYSVPAASARTTLAVKITEVGDCFNYLTLSQITSLPMACPPPPLIKLAHPDHLTFPD